MVVTKVEMMTKIKYKVYLDEQFAFVLYKGELSHYRISEGALLEEETVQEILQKVISKRAKLRAMHLLEDMDRSEAALREKLVQGLYPEEAIETAISYVRSFRVSGRCKVCDEFCAEQKVIKKQTGDFISALSERNFQRDCKRSGRSWL